MSRSPAPTARGSTGRALDVNRTGSWSSASLGLLWGEHATPVFVLSVEAGPLSTWKGLGRSGNIVHSNLDSADLRFTWHVHSYVRLVQVTIDQLSNIVCKAPQDRVRVMAFVTSSGADPQLVVRVELSSAVELLSTSANPNERTSTGSSLRRSRSTNSSHHVERHACANGVPKPPLLGARAVP